MNCDSFYYIKEELKAYMARTQEQNEKISSATKEKIMKAGLKLFSQKGFSITGIKDIAQTAGISTGLIYRHFSTKEELFAELLKNTIEELSKAIRFLESDGSPAQTFNELTSDLLKDIQSSDELSDYFLLITRYTLEKEALPQMEEFKKSDLLLYENAARLIERGQKLGEFKAGDPYKLSLLYFSLIQGMADMKLFLGEKYISPQVRDIMAILLK